jgi:hypothetical protein
MADTTERSTIQKLNNRFNRLEQTFESRGWRSYGNDIKDYLVPDRGRFLKGNTSDETNKGRKDDRQYIYDDAGEQALGVLVSLFMSLLTPQTSPWFKLRVANPSLQAVKRVRMWLDDVTQLLLDVFAQSNIYGVLNNTYTEFCSFATGAQFVLEDEIRTLLPISLTYGEYFLATNARGEVDTIARRLYMTAEQMRDQFGEEVLSDGVKQELKNNQGNRPQYFQVKHLVEPNDGRSGVGNPQGLPFNNTYWEDASVNEAVNSGDSKLLSIGGFHEFPVMAPRWNVISNDSYGKESPGMRMLGDMKMLQSIVEDLLIASKRVGLPPVVSSSDFNQVNTLPDGVSTVTDGVGGVDGIKPLFQNYRPDLQALYAIVEKVEGSIERGFFNDLALIVSGADSDRMTATEVVARNEEKFALLGPVLDKLNNELLKPLIDRTFNILSRQGFFDEDGLYPLPPELSDTELDVEYTSILAKAQKAVGLNNVDRFIERMSVLAQLDPSALDRLDTDATVELYGQNVPARVLREVEEAIRIREDRALQQQAAAEMAAMESGAQVTKDLANSPAGTGTALDEVEENL